ncbi:MAG: filamentous hemagglutinin N-terminal domain-containing protein, partial [Deltaproteobacteria bacterium]
MNKAYRTIWSRVREALVVVSEIVTGKGGPSTAKVAAAVISVFLLLTAGVAYALPSGGQVAAGQVVISAPTSQQMNIKQGTNQAIINWNSFGIGKGEAVKITQPTSQSTLLNRVLGNNPSNIFGSLTANAQVFLVNPSGVLFAPGASVNVGGLVASSLNIKDNDF